MTVLNIYALDLNALPIAGRQPLLMAVLTEGAIGDYAVYESIVDADTPRTVAADHVAQHGAKCTHKRAVTYFPDIPRDKYRA